MAALAGAAALACAGQAAAHVYTIDFTVSGLWTSNTATPPYGLSSNPTLTGSFTGDTSLLGGGFSNGAETITSINFTTGTKTWSIADLDLWDSWVNFGGTPADDPTGFGLFLGTGVWNGTNVVYLDTVGVGPRDEHMICNNCLQVSGDLGVLPGAPEPSTWAMMLLGLFASAAVLRSRRRAGLSSPNLPACA